MNKTDRALARLLRSAARAPQEEHETAPFGFERRVLAGDGRSRRFDARKRADSGEGDMPAFVRLVRQGLIWASVLMVIALAASYYHSQTNVGGDADLTASAWAIIARDP